MKRYLFLAAISLALFFALMAPNPIPALAEPMPDITKQCAFSAEKRRDSPSHLTDKRMKTSFRWYPSTVVQVRPKVPVYGIYLQWDEAPGLWEIRVRRDGEWTLLYTGGDDGFYHEYLPMDGIDEPFQLRSASGQALPPLAEMSLLGEGDLPSWVQTWQETPQKVALMVLSAHCDDELVFMGGVLPTYAGEQCWDTVVVYMCASSAQRRHEALDGLWECGVRQHPVFGPFRDFRTESLKEACQKWGRDKACAFVMEMIREYKPDVLVSHDLNGEYGHGAHRLTADAALTAAHRGADSSFMPDSFQRWDGWQPLKTYLHLYPENTIELDFDIPLPSLGNRTGREIADIAFRHHVSQQKIHYRASQRGRFDCAKWGLVFSLVGDDERKDDLFEHIRERYEHLDRGQWIF